MPIELANIDTTAVSPARAKQLERLVTKAAFFALPARAEQGTRDIGADNGVTFAVTVERPSGSHTVSFADNGSGLAPSAPPALGPLVREVLEGGSA